MLLVIDEAENIILEERMEIDANRYVALTAAAIMVEEE